MHRDRCAYRLLFTTLSKTQVHSDGALLFSASRIIAPYLSDVDTRGIGNITYREDSSTALLNRTRLEIQRAFENSSNFEPTNLFIVTWNTVGYYNDNTDKVSV